MNRLSREIVSLSTSPISIQAPSWNIGCDGVPTKSPCSVTITATGTTLATGCTSALVTNPDRWSFPVATMSPSRTSRISLNVPSAISTFASPAKHKTLPPPLPLPALPVEPPEPVPLPVELELSPAHSLEFV